jgi:hypothetical protein
LSHADGRAQFAELARPLVTKVVPGVYRDLLIDRLAESIKLNSARLNQLWFNEVTDKAGNHLAGSGASSESGSRARQRDAQRRDHVTAVAVEDWSPKPSSWWSIFRPSHQKYLALSFRSWR